MTADLTAHPLPFGGLALVPVSDAGRDWLDGVIVAAEVRVTMQADAIGFEPQDWPEIVTAARDAGLIIEGVE